MRGSVLFLGLPPTGFGFSAKENDSMDAKIAHPRGKNIKAKIISPAEMQVMVISATGENNALNASSSPGFASLTA